MPFGVMKLFKRLCLEKTIHLDRDFELREKNLQLDHFFSDFELREKNFSAILNSKNLVVDFSNENFTIL